MEAKTTIKLNQPKELPAEWLTTVQFKPWKNHVPAKVRKDLGARRQGCAPPAGPGTRLVVRSASSRPRDRPVVRPRTGPDI